MQGEDLLYSQTKYVYYGQEKIFVTHVQINQVGWAS